VIIIQTFKKLSLFVLFILLLSVFSGCIESDEDVGKDFVFTSVTGETKHLSDYRGKVVIIDMWATWCFPCQLVMPELKKIYGNYSRDKLEIISINVDLQESVQLIQSYQDWFNDTYGIELNWIFGRDDGSISEKYLKEGKIPSFAIFDQNGRLYFNEAGVVAYDEVPPLFPENTTLLAPILDELIK
jgi:cytochrome c biogenesis protein CcmG/thiol:disulfide interchange protein DsbE